MRYALSRFALAASVAGVLAGCASYSGIEPRARLEALPTPSAPSAVEPAPLSAAWWQGFEDPQLDRLVAQALESQPGLRVAQARVDRARAVLEVASAATLPQVNGALDLTRQRYTATGAVPPPLAGSIRENGLLQLAGGWEVDFFGKYRSALEAALGTARAAQAELDAARVLLSANVVRTYVQSARIQDQLRLAEQTLAQREHALRLVRDRVDAGLDSQLELRQSESGLPDARQQIEALREQATLTRNALAALLGAPARDPLAQAPSLARLHPLALPQALPVDLLGQRADIAAARWRAEAAGHEIDSAKAQFYPNVNLMAFAGLSSIGLSRLLDADSLQWGVGPAVRLPIFDAGRLRANLRGKSADYDAAVESYHAAVNDALREVADPLASAPSIARQQAEQREAQRSAEAAYDIALQRYRAGLGNYLHVLTAENAVLAQRRLGVELAARALDTQAQLARALGGGWSATPSSKS